MGYLEILTTLESNETKLKTSKLQLLQIFGGKVNENSSVVQYVASCFGLAGMSAMRLALALSCNEKPSKTAQGASKDATIKY